MLVGEKPSIKAFTKKYSRENKLAKGPRLVEILAAVPENYKKKLAPYLKAKPIRTASGSILMLCDVLSMLAKLENLYVFKCFLLPSLPGSKGPSLARSVGEVARCDPPKSFDESTQNIWV